MHKIPIIRHAANLLFDGVCRVKIALRAIFRGFTRKTQQTPGALTKEGLLPPVSTPIVSFEILMLSL
jgi:hypothetical protein